MKRATQPIKGINFMAIKWTLETCKADALNYKSKTEWDKNSPGYRAALKKDWLEECCGHMKTRPKKWTLETCKADALKYKSRHEWQKSSPAYQAAFKNKWLEECCKHMKTKIKPRCYWNLKTCKTDALNYKSRSEWAKLSAGAYDKAHKNGWLKECCGHMSYISEKNKWTIEKCKQDALNYKNRVEWQKKSPNIYKAAHNKGWIEECCKHMKRFGGTSILEQELQKTIKEKFKNKNVVTNKFFTISLDQKQKLNLPHVFRYELDIYIPELKLGVEFNGSYWHSFKGLKRSRPNWTKEQIDRYHIDKVKYFNNLGIKIIMISEKDWNTNKKNILKQIDANLNVLKTRYNNCEVSKK